MLEHKYSGEWKILKAKDINFILKYAKGYANRAYLQNILKYENISFAIKIDNKVRVIVVMMVGEHANYIALLWTDGSFKAIKIAMTYFRDLAKKSSLLFHSKNNVGYRHRCNIAGDHSGKPYYKVVV